MDVSDIDAAYADVTPYSSIVAAWLALTIGAPPALRFAPADADAHNKGAAAGTHQQLLAASITPHPHIIWTGQIFSLRVLHRSLVFFTLCTDGRAGAHACVDVCVRRDVVGDAAMDIATHTLKVGDIARVCGALERVAGVSSYPLLHTAVPVVRIVSWIIGGNIRGAAYLRYADPPQAPRGGLPFDYSTRIAGEEAAATLSSSVAVPVYLSPRTPLPRATVAAEREEAIFEGVPLHRLCRHYVASGLLVGCRWASDGGCAMLHEVGVLEAGAAGEAARRRIVAAWGRWRAKVRRLGFVALEGDERGAVPGRALERAGHSARAGVFAAWLLEKTQGGHQRIDATANGQGAASNSGGLRVLDIAGGRGDVAAALARAGMQIVTVDPRPPNPTKQMLRKAKREKNGGGGEGSSGSTAHVTCLFNSSFTNDPTYAALLASRQLVIGFHPDEATDAIVDFALAQNLPLAVVPCCVFARSFPERRRADGGDVHSFDQFVDYLRLKFAAAGRPASTSFLEYAGANLVLHEGLDSLV